MQMNSLCAQFLSAGRPQSVCTTRDLKLRVIQYLVTLFCPGRQQIWLQDFSPSAAPWAGHAPPPAWWAGRQTHLCVQFLSAGRPLAVCTTRNLKLRVTQYLVILFCPRQSANMAVGLLPFHSSLGRTPPLARRAGRQTRLCAQFLSAGGPLAVWTTRNLKLRVIQYLVILFCPGRQQI